MYSHEIEEKLKSENYYIDSDTYLNICYTSPQISRVKYDTFSNDYNIWTKDNWHWTFKIKPRGEIEYE